MDKITGYRELTSEEAYINGLKELAEEVGSAVETLERNEDWLDIDARWVAIGKTNLQQGFMALTRAVAKPTTF